MATANLGLEVINSSDYVSPTPINNNMKKIDALGIDYITEKGTSGEWWYRKWASGRAECGIDSKQFGEQTMIVIAEGGEIFRTPDLSFGSYPFAFAARPNTIIMFEGDSNWDGRASFICIRHSTSTTLSPNFYVADFDRTHNMKPMCGIYVCGRYK